MNPKKMLKRIFGVALLVFVFCFTVNVFAVDKTQTVVDDGSGKTTDTGTGNNKNTNTNTNTNAGKDSSKKGDDKDPIAVANTNKCGAACTKNAESTSVATEFKLEISHEGGNQYRITMGKNSKVTFTIASINGNPVTGADAGKVLGYRKDIVVNIYGTYDDKDGSGLDGVLVQLKSSDCIYNSVSSCYWEYVTVDLFTTEGTLKPVYSQASYARGSLVDANYLAYTIDCANNIVRTNGKTQSIVRGSGSFEDRFCYAKEHASKKYSSGINNRNNNELIKFKCDYNLESIPANESTLVGDKYFTNKQYLYGVSTYSETEKLVYHYAPSYIDDSNTISCDVTCEEAVEVEYGPPVASAAGMCFEYKVRVTSRVSCNMSKAPSSADLCKTQVCAPKPQCYHKGGQVYTQAGPNEDFDACVKKCDGGVYSKKCSTSCYNKIYGSVSAHAKTNSVYYDDLFAVQLSRNYHKGLEADDDVNLKYCLGYYDKTAGSYESDWYGYDTDYPGRWYCDKGWRTNPAKHLSYYYLFYADYSGFFRKYTNGSPCSADCRWENCESNVYVNNYIPCYDKNGNVSDASRKAGMTDADREKYCKKDGVYKGFVNILEYDCAKNQERYNNLVKQCQSMASCTTTQAEFTISASYTKLGKEKETWIDFPYNSDPDHLKPGDTVSTSQTSKTTTLLPDYPAKDEGILGCYQNDGDKNLYRSTWGFPGSWRNLKTNEVSYDPSVAKENQGAADGGGNKSIWYAYKGKFCIPGDAKSVNTAWWNAYKHRQLVNTGVINDLSTSKNSEFNEACGKNDNSVLNPNTNYAPEKYNIKAHAKDFGYFGWDIDIECFYAINDNALNTASASKDDSICPAPGVAEGEEFRVRSTDLGNLFPSASGEDLASPDTAGRTPGYNWSEYAVNTKNTDYKSNPVKYMQALQEAAKKAQSGGTDMYTNDNLDYQFYLTPTVLREMRKDRAGAGGSNYTSFSDSGFTIDSNGVGRYYSKKIRNLGSDNKLPLNNDSLYCNNMVNWQTPGCDTIHND